MCKHPKPQSYQGIVSIYDHEASHLPKSRKFLKNVINKLKEYKPY